MRTRPSWLPIPTLLVGGYLAALVAVVAINLVAPFSWVSITLLWLVIGLFFLVSIPIVLLVGLLLLVGLTYAWVHATLRGLGILRSGKAAVGLAPRPSLWDVWLDGPALDSGSGGPRPLGLDLPQFEDHESGPRLK